MDYRTYIRDVPDFPKPGIMFRDICPLLAHPPAVRSMLFAFESEWTGKIDAIVALDARGFLIGMPLAVQMGLPFAPIRKAGKLPGETIATGYGLEYGTDTVEIQVGAFAKGSRVLVIDDVLATGGTAAAACELLYNIGCKVAGCAFLIELAELGGRKKLTGEVIQSLVVYEPVAA